MDTHKPLSYASLKCVIQFMDANVRFHLVQKCPKIRTLEKMLPLKINSIEFKPFTIRVNDAMYELDTYRHYNQLTIRSPTRNKIEFFDSVENSEGGKTDYINCDPVEVMEHLLKKLFGQRKTPIQVKTMIVNTTKKLNEHYPFCPFPLDMKLVIQELKVTEYPTKVSKVLEIFQSVMHASSFPLKLLEVTDLSEDNQEVIKTAKKLVLSDDVPPDAFVHCRVHFHNDSYDEEYVESIIEKWQRNGREVGTYYSFASICQEEVERYWKFANEQPGARLEKPKEKMQEQFLQQIILPIRDNDNAEICICCEKAQKELDYQTIQWIFKMKVQEK